MGERARSCVRMRACVCLCTLRVEFACARARERVLCARVFARVIPPRPMQPGDTLTPSKRRTQSTSGFPATLTTSRYTARCSAPDASPAMAASTARPRFCHAVGRGQSERGTRESRGVIKGGSGREILEGESRGVGWDVTPSSSISLSS